MCEFLFFLPSISIVILIICFAIRHIMHKSPPNFVKKINIYLDDSFIVIGLIYMLFGLVFASFAGFNFVTKSKCTNISDIFNGISLISFGLSLLSIVGFHPSKKETSESQKETTDKKNTATNPINDQPSQDIDECKSSLIKEIKKVLDEKESIGDLKRQISYLEKENDTLRTQLEEKNRAYDKLVDKILDSQKEVCVLSKIAKKIKK